MNRKTDTTKRLRKNLFEQFMKGRQSLKVGLSEKGKFIEAEGAFVIFILAALVALALFLK